MKSVISGGIVRTASVLTILLSGCLHNDDNISGDPQPATSAAVATPTTSPSTTPPATNPPGTNPPATNPPTTNPPTTNPPTTNPPTSTNVAALSQQEAVAAALKYVDDRVAAFATAVPTTADERYKTHDACYKDDGYTKEFLKQAFVDPTDLRSRESQAYAVGFTRGNVSVLAMRYLTNADGTTRNEIDVEYDQVNTKEGTTQRVSRTLVNGSTTGVCASGTNSADVRLLGNQRNFSVGLLAINQFLSDFLLATGAAATPPQTARRALRIQVRDPQGAATYAVVSRQPAGLWALKLISPRLLATDPSFAAKPGNYVTGYEADDFFRACQTSGGSLVGVLADCTLGTTIQDIGTTINTGFDNTTDAEAAAGDATFASFTGFTAGERYKFEIFNDDGWKTVNGQLGKTPIATYEEQVDRLPYTFTELLTGPARLTRSPPALSLTTAQIGAAFLGTADVMIQVTNGGFSALPDARKFGRQTHFVFAQGPALTTVAPNFWPARRSVDYYFAVGSANAVVTTPAFTIRGRPADMRERTIGQTAQIYTDRNNSQLRIVGNYRN